MRQAILVVVLVMAAFLGGTMANGAGIRWIQSRLLDYMGLKDSGEITSIDLPLTTTDGAACQPLLGNLALTNPPRESIPAGTDSAKKLNANRNLDNTPKLSENLKTELSVGGMSAKSSQTDTQSSSPSPFTSSRIPEPASPQPGHPAHQSTLARRVGHSNESTASLPSSSARDLTPGERLASSSSGSQKKELSWGIDEDQSPRRHPNAFENSGPSPAPLDPSVGPALLAALSPGLLRQVGRAERTKTDTIPLEVAPISPPSSPPSRSSTNSLPGNSGATNRPQMQWMDLCHKMRILGVTRYTVEGELGGRVTFSCLIPLAGRQAVTQRFEAEGDDEIQAAQRAIRRISLWQATRISPSP